MSEQHPLIGLARLMRQAYAGNDMVAIGDELMARAADPEDANALMDLSTLLQLRMQRDLALALQRQALAVSQLYHHPAARGPAIRLLALVAPGDIQSYTPLEFLLEDSDVALDHLYVGHGLPFPDTVPDHDILFVAINESDANGPLLEALAGPLADWPKPVLERPERIPSLSRDRAPELLRDAPRVAMPGSVRLGRRRLAELADESQPLPQGYALPLIVRPVGSHAGKDLEKVETRTDIAAYLERVPGELFYLSPFIDYRSPDGQFRKYRVALIEGKPYACHMGISDHWIIHYANAGMDESAEKRAEEAQWMAGFDQDFAVRHADALAGIQSRFGLDYLIIDCAETPDGRLLVFELDTGGVIHDMDPPELYPYKPAQMRKVFDAFHALLEHTLRR